MSFFGTQLFGGNSEPSQARLISPGGLSRDTPARGRSKPVDVSDYPRERTCSICMMFFLFLWFTPISMVFFYHAGPTTVISLFIVWNMITLFPWAFHAGGVLASDISGPMLTLTLFSSVFLSFLGGIRCYYQNAQPMRQLAAARDYRGVYPELPGSSFPDAAYIEFVGNATVDTSKAMSYQSLDSGLSTFCVAPIGSPGNTGRHDFWAIGVDCCDIGGSTKDKFRCYDAGQPDVKTGWVLPSKFGDTLFTTIGRYVSPAEGRRDLFVKALQKAEAVYGVASPGEEAIFIRWTKTKKEDIMAYEFVNMVVTVLIQGAILAAQSLLLTRLYQRFTHVRKIHRTQLHGASANSEEEDITARLHQFMSDALEDARDSDMGGSIQRFQDATSQESIVRFAQKHRPPPDPMDMCRMTIAVPYLLLMLCAVLSTFSPCWRLGHLVTSTLYCLTFIFILSLLATPSRGVNGCFILLCCTAGYYIGMSNYKQNMFHYCSTSDRRLYKEVPASAETADYWDAGRLQFDTSAMLSTHHSVGFLDKGTTYCAAPVIARDTTCKHGAAATHAHGHIAAAPNATSFWQAEVDHAWNLAAMEKKRLDTFEEFAESQGPHMAPPSFMQRRSGRQHAHLTRRHRRHREVPASEAAAGGCAIPAAPRIEFWATGVDCCSARGRFWCDGGDVADAREAVVVRAFGDEESEGPKIRSDRGMFFKAIDQAVAAFELPLPDRPVLLRWGKSAKELQADYWQRAIGVIGLTAIASLIIILVIGIGSYFFSRHARRQELKEQEEYQRKRGGDAGPAPYEGPPSPRPSLPMMSGPTGGNRPPEDDLRF